MREKKISRQDAKKLKINFAALRLCVKKIESMKYNLKIILVLISVMMISATSTAQIHLRAWAKHQNPDPDLIPQPQHLKMYSTGYYTLKETSVPVINTTDSDSSVERHISLKNFRWDIESIQSISFADIDFYILSANDAVIGNEGYHLKIDSTGVTISANTPSGLYYGFQTLRQLIMLYKTRDGAEIKIPHLTITDFPAFGWRGMMLDCCRHFMEKEFILRYIDLLSFYKMNVFHWHLTEDQGWRMESEKYPLLTEVGAWRREADGSIYGGYYTRDDILEVVAYASARGITVVPEIEMPGHALAALASYPALSCTGGPFEVATTWGVFKDIFCAGNDSVFIFLKDILDEVMELFPSEYIHIGGDEAPKYRWENCMRCQKRISENNLKDEHELQSWFIGEIANYLKKHNRKLIGWDEIIDGGLVDGITVQSWRGFEGAHHAALTGNNAIVSPVSHAYFDYPVHKLTLERVYQFDPIPAGLDPSLHHHILGGECNMWTERAPQHLVDQKVFPRLLAMSEVLWSYPPMNDTLFTAAGAYKLDTPVRWFEPFRARVRRHYPLLKFLDVDYGLEEGGLKFSTKHIQEGIQMVMTPEQDNIDILYGIGADTFNHNIIYKEPIIIKDSLTLHAAAYIDGKRVSEIYTRRFKLHSGVGLPYSLSMQPGSTYNRNPGTTLTDGIMGTNDFHDGLWLGFWAKDVAIDFKFDEPQHITEISISFLQSNPSWIFLPESVRITIIPKGFLKFRRSYKLTTETSKQEIYLLEDFRLNLDKPIEAKRLKISVSNPGKCPDWHPAAGSPTWIFVDEVEFVVL